MVLMHRCHGIRERLPAFVWHYWTTTVRMGRFSTRVKSNPGSLMLNRGAIHDSRTEDIYGRAGQDGGSAVPISTPHPENMGAPWHSPAWFLDYLDRQFQPASDVFVGVGVNGRARAEMACF